MINAVFNTNGSVVEKLRDIRLCISDLIIRTEYANKPTYNSAEVDEKSVNKLHEVLNLIDDIDLELFDYRAMQRATAQLFGWKYDDEQSNLELYKQYPSAAFIIECLAAGVDSYAWSRW